MSKYGWIIYCNKALRKWEKEPSEGCLTFVVCMNDSTEAPIALPSKELPEISDDMVLKPRPYLGGKLVSHVQLVTYPYAQLKEYVHPVAWKEEWGEGVYPKDNPPATPKSSRTKRDKSTDRGDRDKEIKREKSRDNGKKDEVVSSPRKHHHHDKDKVKSPRTDREHKEKSSSRHDRDKHREKSSHRSKHRDEETSEEEEEEEEPFQPPRTINVDLAKRDYPPKSTTHVHDPAVESLSLDPIALRFLQGNLSEQNGTENQVQLEQSEQNRFTLLDGDISSLKKNVQSLPAPKEAVTVSPFTEEGIRQYLGAKSEDQLTEGEMTQPHISVQGLDEIYSLEGTSPRDGEPLLWSNGKQLNLTKKIWYQMLGRSDDGAFSNDAITFFQELVKASGEKLDLDSDDRVEVATRSVEAMDSVKALDPRLKSRLLEQASDARQKKKRSVSKSKSSNKIDKKR